LFSDGGTPTIVDFIYTRCVSVCTTLGSVFQQMQASIIQERDRTGAINVRLMSISFDPDRDDAGALAAYASRLRADPRIWRFGRTADAADTRTLLDRFQVTVIPDGLGGYEHNAALLVIDGRGRLIRVFDYAEMETALAFARSRPARGDSR
jgi:protein SCO1/2